MLDVRLQDSHTLRLQTRGRLVTDRIGGDGYRTGVKIAGGEARAASAAVALVGLGVVGRAALEVLLRRGNLTVHIADDVAGSTWRGTERAGRLVEVHTHPYPLAGGDWSRPWLTSCDLCLLCADRVDVPVALEVNARCLETGVLLLPGLVMGTVAQVGPVVRGGRSACLACLDLRLRATTGRSCLADFGSGPEDLAESVGQELASRALRALEGGSEELECTLSYLWPQGSVRHHPVLRSWHCGQCGRLGPQPAFRRPRAIELDDEDAGSKPGDILALASALVDPVTGPIRSLERVVPGPEDPPMRHWVAALSDPGWAAFQVPTVPCGGNDLDDARARAAALGEAVERMSACQPLGSAMPEAAYRDVEPDAVDPRSWDLFHPDTRAQPGFPYFYVSPADPITWTWGWSFARERSVMVPASRVFAPFHAQTVGDNADHPAVGGSATGRSAAQAVLGGVLEVIERDAFMIAWANRLALPRIELDSSSPGEVGRYMAALVSCGVEARCCLIPLDLGVPVVVAMAAGTKPGDPAMVVAAAAGLDPAEACRHALAELTANRLNVRHAMTTSTALPPSDPEIILDATAHGLLYARTDMAGQLREWWDSPVTVPLDEPENRPSARDGLRQVLDAVSRAGLEVIAVDVTPPEIRDLGLSVAKALIPGTYPMTFDSRWPHFGGRRLRMAPVHAGLRDVPLPVEALNRVPHPFP